MLVFSEFLLHLTTVIEIITTITMTAEIIAKRNHLALASKTDENVVTSTLQFCNKFPYFDAFPLEGESYQQKREKG